ncbi:ly6/PLAUR domain-containing protein 5-like isoform X2 [Rhinatrema bivittatum]|nr:ly6/PLAUR domain-containing protein 5-like isoform X2 [Rhinatrema bivittatum]XP_029433000.1 ly6/PLAUR domain-containing protein 5-like isoform X2 [Rhinatrema bivittatum]
MTTVHCAPSMNVCVEFMHVIQSGALKLTGLQRGCDQRPTADFSITTTNLLYEYSRFMACNSSLCNNVLNTSVSTPPDNTTDSNVPNDMECYSCLTFQKDQCSPKNAEKIKCTGSKRRCYEGNVTVTTKFDGSSKAMYFKTCESTSICSTELSSTVDFVTIRQQGSCCSGKFCNGPDPSTITTSKPNSQVPCSSVSHFSLLFGILIAIMVL